MFRLEHNEEHRPSHHQSPRSTFLLPISIFDCLIFASTFVNFLSGIQFLLPFQPFPDAKRLDLLQELIKSPHNLLPE